MVLITVARVGCLGSWSASIDGRVICASVRSLLGAAAKALLAEGHEPETETAMKHEGSTILPMRLALAGEPATHGGPSAPHTGSQGGALDAEGVPHPS